MKIAVLLTSLLPLSLIAAPPPETWNNAVSGLNWGTAANWTPNTVPNAQDQSVTIGSAILAGTNTINLDVAPTVTVGSIILQSTTAFGYNVTSATITMPIAPTNTAAHTISAPLVLTSGVVVNNQNNTQNLTLSGVISGGSSFNNSSTGTGLVILSGANTFTGGLINTTGTLQCGQANTLPAAGSVTMTGGTLNLNSNAQTIGALSGTGPVMLGTAALTINTTGNTSYGGNISGSGSLMIGGLGSLTLTTVNAYNGGTTVSSGSLILGIDNAVNGAMTVNSPGILNLNNFNLTVSELSGSGSVTLGTSTTNSLTIQGPTSTIFSGSISGSGNFVQNGTSTLTLSGTNTYTGTTTINGGTILVNTSSSLPSATPVTLTGTGILALNNGISLTVGTLSATGGTPQVQLGSGQLTVAPTASANFAGVASGTGSIVFQGPYVWTIQTPQTYTGGTTINGGTMQMGVANALAPTDPVTVNSPGILNLFNFPLAIASLSGNGSVALGSGALTLNTTTSTTFSGSISGAGSLVVQGSGTQILAGTNFYTGGTTVQGTATLQGTTNSLEGAIVNNSILFINQSFNGTYAGPLSGTGQLNVGGGGTVTLTGTPTQGSTTVLGGELDIASGATLTSAVSVSSGAILGGSGTIAGGVSNFGSIVPSTTFTVTGNVTFQAGSNLVADITPSSSNQLNAGSVNIDPNASVSITVASGIYALDNFYTLISSGSPVVGQFQATDLANPFLSASLLYNLIAPGSVTLGISIKSLSDVIQGGNAGAISQCISRANMAIDPDLESLVSQIIFFSVGKVRDILDEMQPSQLRALTVAEQTNNFFAQQALNWRMAEFDRTTCEKEIGKNFPWNFWQSLAGNYTDQRPDDHNIGYHAPQISFTTGFDGKISDNLFLGVAAEYGHVWFDWKEGQGSSNINRVQAGPYLSYIGRFGYINTSVMGAFARFEAERHIPYFDRTADSKHYGESLLPHIDAGIALHPAPNVYVTPFAAIDFLYGWEGSYKESGAGSLDFKIASSSSRMYRSEVGLKISKCAVRSHTKWVHDLKASWVREERYKGKSLTATFKQFPCSFKVKGLYPSRSLLDVGMGLTFIFKKDRFAATLRYEGQFGEAVSIQSGIGQLLTRF